MSPSDTTQWPLLEERAPLAHRARTGGRRRLSRTGWLLVALAFLCGGLVSAAGFSIGWRHQAQRNNAAEAALASATARVHRLERRILRLDASLGAARRQESRQHRAAVAAVASKGAVIRAAARVAGRAVASRRAAISVDSGAGALTASAARIGSELKTLETYLTTTPTAQLDPGYIASQTTYLVRQLTRLRYAGYGLDTTVASFETAVRQLSRSASTLTRRR